MLFVAAITIPANTSASDPTVEYLNIAHGIITRFMVRPRQGHAALAHMVILHHETQIAPSFKGMDFHGDGDPIDWDEYYESYQPPYELKLQGWNEDDSYPHTFDVFVAVLPRKAIMAYAVVDAIKSAFSALSPKRIFSGSN